MALRKIIRIHEDKCDGCGECIPQCREGALKIVDGKVKLLDERYCDGLGDCIGHCPRGAIEIIERQAEDFDERAVFEHLRELAHAQSEVPHAHGNCPGAAALSFPSDHAQRPQTGSPTSALCQWPVQLTLVPVSAPYLKGADLLLAADCVPFAMADFHDALLAGRRVLVGCPKLDDASDYQEKLSAILRENKIRSLTVAHMEVPCCFGLVVLAEKAVQLSGKEIPIKDITITLRGQVREEKGHAAGGTPALPHFGG